MDKKKFLKFLNKYDLKGLLRMCDTLEEADFILLYHKIDCSKSRFVSKMCYNENPVGDIPDRFIVCFVKHSNPRNKRSLEVYLNKLGRGPFINKY